jgi:type VI protein secretion system component VasK
MLRRWEYWILTLAALAIAALVGVNISLFNTNRAAQTEVTSRAQYIQQTAQLEPLYREMVKALADLSVRNNDRELRDMLAKQGITVSAPAAAAAPPAPEPKKGK